MSPNNFEVHLSGSVYRVTIGTVDAELVNTLQGLQSEYEDEEEFEDELRYAVEDIDDVLYEYAACGFGFGVKVTKSGSDKIEYFGNLDSGIKREFEPFRVTAPGVYVTTSQKERGSHKCFLLTLEDGAAFDPDKMVLKGIMPSDAACGELITAIEYDGVNLESIEETDTDVKHCQIDYFRVIDGSTIELELDDVIAAFS